MRKTASPRFGSRFLIGLTFLFLYAPIFILIIFSFNAGASSSVWKGFSLHWYGELFHNRLILQSIYTTLLVSLLATVVATFAGTFAAIGFHAMRRRPRHILTTVNNIPMMNADIVTGVSLCLLFVAFFAGWHSFAVWVNSWQSLVVLPERLTMGFGTLLLAHICFNIPYVILSVGPKLRQMDRNLIDAAQDLGCTWMQAFWKVVLPEIKPGIVSGALTAFTMSVDDFIISYFTAGTASSTLAMTIYGMTKKRVSPQINAISTLLFVTVLLLLALVNLRENRAQSRNDKLRRGEAVPPKRQLPPALKRVGAGVLAAALIAALVLLYNKCEWFRNAVNSVINFFKETLTAGGSVAKSVFEGIGNVIGSVMDAAKATVSEKLSNIKTAYEEHGGGISGVAAAAMEAVKGWYTAGYTFIDNLTGGKLSEIREKFSTAMSNIVQGISQKFTDARTAFSNGLNNIKNAVSGAVTWFFESGKRIVSTFANGIKSAFSSAVEAVKGGLQKIRNLLPFSDAKEGPLSTLTLSGQRTMTTYAHGLTLAGDAPAEAMNKSLQQVQGALDREPEKKIDLGGGKKDKDESGDEGGSGKGKQVIIHKLLVPVDLKKIKDLQQLLALLQEVEDYAAANEDGEPGDDEDAAPAPA